MEAMAFGSGRGKGGELKGIQHLRAHPQDYPYFKYMGILLLVADDDWQAVIQNLMKAQAVWRRILKILSRRVARLQVSEFYLKAVVQSVLMFGAEKLLVNPQLRQVLGGFQEQVARRLMKRMSRWGLEGRWEYTSEKAAREEVGFELVETCIRRRQNTVASTVNLMK